MIVLLLRIQHIAALNKDQHYDDWVFSWNALQKVSERDAGFLLNPLVTIAAPVAGRISRIEAANHKDAYGPDHERYLPRLMPAHAHLRGGRLNARRNSAGSILNGRLYRVVGDAGQSYISLLFVYQAAMKPAPWGCSAKSFAEIPIIRI